jgi:hypothetical protein
MIDGYYVRQNDSRSSPRIVNAVGVVLNLYL